MATTKPVKKHARVAEISSGQRHGTVQVIIGSGVNQRAIVSFDGWLRLKKKSSEVRVL